MIERPEWDEDDPTAPTEDEAQVMVEAMMEAKGERQAYEDEKHTSIPERVDEEVASVGVWAASLDHSLLDVRELPIEAAVVQLAQLREAVKSLRQSEAALEQWIAEVFKDQNWFGPRDFEGVGRIEIHRSKGRRGWDHEQAAHDFMGAWLKKRGGELPTPFEVRDALLGVASVSGWKVKAMQAVGLNVDDYCESGLGPAKVEIVPPVPVHTTASGKPLTEDELERKAAEHDD